MWLHMSEMLDLARSVIAGLDVLWCSKCVGVDVCICSHVYYRVYTVSSTTCGEDRIFSDYTPMVSQAYNWVAGYCTSQVSTSFSFEELSYQADFPSLQWWSDVSCVDVEKWRVHEIVDLFPACYCHPFHLVYIIRAQSDIRGG